MPAAPLRQRLLLGAAVTWVLVAGLALAVHFWLGTSWRQPVVGMVLFSAVLALALAGLRDAHPFPRFGPANRITLARAGLAAIAAGMLTGPASSELGWLLVAITVAVVTLDGVDGWFARRSGMASRFGARFDMETDAFFMLVLAALVWQLGKAGGWVLATGMMRYAFVAGGWMWPWLARPLRSTIRGKGGAIFTTMALGVSVAPVVPREISVPLCAAALAGLSFSFAVDIRFLWRSR